MPTAPTATSTVVGPVRLTQGAAAAISTAASDVTKNATWVSTANRYVRRTAGSRASRSGRPTIIAWCSSIVAVAQAHHSSPAHPARCTSRRPIRDRTPLRPWGARKAAVMSHPSVRVPAATDAARAIGRPHPTTWPGSLAPGAGPCHQDPATARPPNSPAATARGTSHIQRVAGYCRGAGVPGSLRRGEIVARLTTPG